jgi:hypothetical protein
MDELSLYKSRLSRYNIPTQEGKVGIPYIDKRVKAEVYPCKREKTGIPYPYTRGQSN